MLGWNGKNPFSRLHGNFKYNDIEEKDVDSEIRQVLMLNHYLAFSDPQLPL